MHTSHLIYMTYMYIYLFTSHNFNVLFFQKQNNFCFNISNYSTFIFCDKHTLKFLTIYSRDAERIIDFIIKDICIKRKEKFQETKI